MGSKVAGALAKQTHTKKKQNTQIHQLLVGLTDLTDPTVLRKQALKILYV